MLGFFAFGFAALGLPPSGNQVALSVRSKSLSTAKETGSFRINAAFLDPNQVKQRTNTTPLITVAQNMQAATSSVRAAALLQAALSQNVRTMSAAFRSFTTAIIPLSAKATFSNSILQAVTFLALPFSRIQSTSAAQQGASFGIGLSAALTETVAVKSAAVLALAARARSTFSSATASAARLAVASRAKILATAEVQALESLFTPLAVQANATTRVASRATLVVAAGLASKANTAVKYVNSLAIPLAVKTKTTAESLLAAVLTSPLALTAKASTQVRYAAVLGVASALQSSAKVRMRETAALVVAARNRFATSLGIKPNSDAAIHLSPSMITTAAHVNLRHLATINIQLISRTIAVVRAAIAPFFHTQKYTAVAKKRSWIASPKAPDMARTLDLSPAIDAVSEVAYVTFDFGFILQPGDTLVSVAQINCTVETGTDPSPASRIQGFSMIGTSPETGAPSAAVQQLFGNMVADCDYILQCVARTASGQTLSVWARLACEAVG